VLESCLEKSPTPLPACPERSFFLPAGPSSNEIVKASRGRDRHGVLFVAALMAAYVGLYGELCIHKYHYFLYTDFDLAIFVQAVDGLLHGTLYSSIRGMNWLGDHTSLVMFLVAPLYAIARSPVTLLLVQTVALALGALPVYGLARRQLPSAGVAIALSAAYLLQPALGYTNLFEFHPEVLSTSALLWAFYALLENQRGWMVTASVLALLGKEDVALAVLGMAFYALSLRRSRDAGILAGLAALSLIVSFAILKPALGGTAHGQYEALYARWGKTTGEVVLNLVRHPGRALAAFWDTPGDAFDSAVKRNYYLVMLLPWAFLPLLSPRTLAIPVLVLALHFLSYRFHQHTIVFQYTALITPFVSAAAVLGLRHLLTLVPKGARSSPDQGDATGTDLDTPMRRGAATVVATLVIVVSVFANVSYGPVVGGGPMLRAGPTQPLHASRDEKALQPYRDAFLARIPRQGGVVASFEFLARLARGHPDLQSLHFLLLGHYTVSELPYPVPSGVVALIGDMGSPATLSYLRAGAGARLREALARNRLSMAAAAGDLVLFLRQPEPSLPWVSLATSPPQVPAAAVYDSTLTLVGFDRADTTVDAGRQLNVRTYWSRVGTGTGRVFFMRLALVDGLGRVVVDHPRPLGYGLEPPQDWTPGATMLETGRLVIPATVAPGSYRLEAHMEWRGEGDFQAHADCLVNDPAMRTLRLGRVVVTAPRQDRG
jgi:uncharacterized membrane protein